MLRLFRRWYRYVILILVTCILCSLVNTSPAQTLPVKQLVQQGIERYQAGKSTEAIALWQQALSQTTSAKDKAIIRTNLAQAYRQIGQTSEAIAQWEQAIQIYRQQKDAPSRRQLAALLTEQAQAYSDLGQHRQAIALAQLAIESDRQLQNRLVLAAAHGVLGNGYLALGDYKAAMAASQTSLKIAQELNNSTYIATGLNNLGHVLASRAARYRYLANAAQLEGDDREEIRLTNLARQDLTAAEKAFEQAAKQGTSLHQVRALLNLNRLWQQAENGRSPASKRDLIQKNQNRIWQMLATVPDSRDKAYASINLATSFDSQPQKKIEILQPTLSLARNLGDRRAESFVLGGLGQVYESTGQYDKAIELTRQAAFAAQQIDAADSLYRWQWQTGRILRTTGKIPAAISAYEQAIATLQSIRGDIAAANKDMQFDFRDSVEPVYRESIALLLDTSEQPSVTTKIGAANFERNIIRAVDVSELLKLAELQNFFGDECVQVALENAKRERSAERERTAVVYSMILGDRTATILQLPNGALKLYSVTMGAEQLQPEIDELRLLLEKRATDEYLPQAQKIYNALIRPMEADLTAAQPNTLVFINDGVLRKVPMGALHDGKQFLVEKYAIATTPSLSLTDRQPLNRDRLSGLILGLTVERPPFNALVNVKDEAINIEKILTGTMLLDRNFTIDRLQTELQKRSYPIVHMATHGKFGVDADGTFLLTYDSQLNIEQLDNLLRKQRSSPSSASRRHREPVELLTLSACQTAAGDNRSVLGMAGIAVRAGVKSALASLWFLNDESTVPLIEEFYTQLLQPGVTKAEALRRAQIKAIRDRDYGHPAVWSPFILIGNWL